MVEYFIDQIDPCDLLPRHLVLLKVSLQNDLLAGGRAVEEVSVDGVEDVIVDLLFDLWGQLPHGATGDIEQGGVFHVSSGW